MKASLRFVARTLGVLAAGLTLAQGPVQAVVIHTIGPADEGQHLIRYPAEERVDHRSLVGTLTRTASQARRGSEYQRRARDIRSPSDLDFGPEGFGTVTSTASERSPLLWSVPRKSARTPRTLDDLEPAPARFGSVDRVPPPPRFVVSPAGYVVER